MAVVSEPAARDDVVIKMSEPNHELFDPGAQCVPLLMGFAWPRDQASDMGPSISSRSSRAVCLVELGQRGDDARPSNASSPLDSQRESNPQESSRSPITFLRYG